jgi:hypothetical protein
MKGPALGTVIQAQALNGDSDAKKGTNDAQNATNEPIIEHKRDPMGSDMDQMCSMRRIPEHAGLLEIRD